MITNRIDGRTPNGGDYSEIVYMNSRNELIDEARATKAIIREFRNDGSLVAENFMLIEPEA